MGPIKKIIMQIDSDYVSSNIIIWLCFFYSIFLKVEIQKYLHSVLAVQMKTWNFTFDINWSLESIQGRLWPSQKSWTLPICARTEVVWPKMSSFQGIRGNLVYIVSLGKRGRWISSSKGTFFGLVLLWKKGRSINWWIAPRKKLLLFWCPNKKVAVWASYFCLSSFIRSKELTRWELETFYD